jgi:hypothetical protein
LNYNIYGNGGSGPIDYTTPLGSTSSLTYATAALAYPNEWRFAVRADDGTYEETNIDAVVRLVLDAGGVDVTNLPAAPSGLSAWPIAGGSIRVSWVYPARAIPTGFKVYVGTPTVSYGSPAVTVPWGSPRTGHFQTDLSGLADATAYQVAVRAYNATGEEANTAVTTATTKAAGPGAVTSATISTDPADW